MTRCAGTLIPGPAARDAPCLNPDRALYSAEQGLETVDVNLALLADAANVGPDGKLNILGTFDTIHAQTFPAVHPVMRLVLRFVASPAEVGQQKEITIRVLTQDGKVIGDLKGNLLVPEPTSPGHAIHIQTILDIPKTVYEDPGDYAFHVLVGGEEKSVIPLSLVQSGNLAEESDDS